MLLMEVLQEALRIHEVFWGFPSVFRFRVVFPFDQVLRLAIVSSCLDNSFGHVFFRSVDFLWFVMMSDVDGVFGRFE